MKPLLQVDNLSIGFGNEAPVVNDVSFSVNAGETLALVGESGSGKTITCRSVLRILPSTGHILGGRITFTQPDQTLDLLSLPERSMRDLRGNLISMIFQEPMRALSPLHRIGNQVTEVLYLHGKYSKRAAKDVVLQKFERVGFTDPLRIFEAYPFELSGGMRQRTIIAMAMVAKPELLIADEPTTALDVTTQAQVLGLIKDLQRETGMAVLLVTHDLGVVANMAEQVVVLNQGRVMESGKAADVLGEPAHPYTQKLFKAAPVIPAVAKGAPPIAQDDLILSMTDVSKTYYVRGSSAWKPSTEVMACCEINLNVQRGKTLAVVGESGSGKTTCARIALGAEKPDSGGSILFRPKNISGALPVHNMNRDQRFAFQRQAQMVFQDPYSSLNPRMRVIDVLTEPLEIHGIGNRAEQRERAAERLVQVGLNPDMLYRYPHAFSGGQRQRLSIARALTLDPEFVVCDEPTSALDVSVQDQILTLLEDIRDRMNLSFMFISHDLAVIARIADDVAVMRQGIVVEQAPPATLFYDPRHPYTKALIAARPEPDINRPIDLSIVSQGAGAPSRWPEEFRMTSSEFPALAELSPGHMVRCHV